MTEPSAGGARWVAVLAAVLAIAVGAWWLLRTTPDPSSTPGAPAGDATAPSGPGVVSFDLEGRTVAGFRVAQNGRLRIERDALPETGPLHLALELPDDARGEGDHTARVVSDDARRLDVVAKPLAGAGSGLGVAIDPAFLSGASRYMVEVDTEGTHPLRIRRYVIELE